MVPRNRGKTDNRVFRGVPLGLLPKDIASVARGDVVFSLMEVRRQRERSDRKELKEGKHGGLQGGSGEPSLVQPLKPGGYGVLARRPYGAESTRHPGADDVGPRRAQNRAQGHSWHAAPNVGCKATILIS